MYIEAVFPSQFIEELITLVMPSFLATAAGRNLTSKRHEFARRGPVNRQSWGAISRME